MTKEQSWHETEYPTGQDVHDFAGDPRWRQKLLTPTQLLVSDIRIETYRADRDPLLEVTERSAAKIVPPDAAITPSEAYIRAAEVTENPIEKQHFTTLEEEYGWIRHLRLKKFQADAFDDPESAKVRWIHVSSRFPEYIRGVLWALSDDHQSLAEVLRVLDTTIQRQTRFSKHGKTFAPFFQPLKANGGDGSGTGAYPLLLSVPFLDWTVLGPSPPLRFQVDKREGYWSSRTSTHVLRSILQHFYRLEDTRDREPSQVFAKHKPWRTDRELDLRVRRWYGQYPSALNVDELWVLAIDAEHIVTFSSNQTWKSRWPPMQLSSRISDVSFRSIRNNFYRAGQTEEYTALTHAIASLAGACGMVHRSFWSDLVLPCTDRYASYLGGLQYRLHRAPSTRLVMDLMAAQEELNIVIHITREQIVLIKQFQDGIESRRSHQDAQAFSSDNGRSTPMQDDSFDITHSLTQARHRQTYRDITMSGLVDPMAQLLDNLQRELVDLQDLRDNTDRLVTRTIQLVNIRLEDHGKAILAFTVTTIVFLPLNFLSSYFGMNTIDIRNMDQTQSLFWIVACCVTFFVVASSIFIAFFGSDLVEKYHLWRDARRERMMSTTTVRRPTMTSTTFAVHGVGRTY